MIIRVDVRHEGKRSWCYLDHFFAAGHRPSLVCFQAIACGACAVAYLFDVESVNVAPRSGRLCLSQHLLRFVSERTNTVVECETGA